MKLTLPDEVVDTILRVLSEDLERERNTGKVQELQTARSAVEGAMMGTQWEVAPGTSSAPTILRWQGSPQDHEAFMQGVMGKDRH